MDGSKANEWKFKIKLLDISNRKNIKQDAGLNFKSDGADKFYKMFQTTVRKKSNRDIDCI